MVFLDTHAWLWWVSAPEKLGAGGRDALDRAERVAICTISCWEIAMLSVRGRIALDREVHAWIEQALANPRVEAVPLTSDVAVRAALLARDGFHGDPADRLIYASARAAGARLVTRDARIAAFDPRTALW